MNHFRLGTTVAALALGAALTIATAPKAHADDARARCQSHVEKAQDHYRHEAHAHGKDSPQAQDAKAKLQSEWDRCYTEAHGWYDPNTRQWRTDRDWDHNYDWNYNENH